jgi:hypothetical protein
MRKIGKAVIMIGIFNLLTATACWAQSGMDQGGGQGRGARTWRQATTSAPNQDLSQKQQPGQVSSQNQPANPQPGMGAGRGAGRGMGRGRGGGQGMGRGQGSGQGRGGNW